jgi:U4/U6 small nuclear ribonucleoprotein PRP31
MSKFNINTIALQGLHSLSDEEDILSDEDDIFKKEVKKDEKPNSLLLSDSKFQILIEKIDRGEEMNHKTLYIDNNSRISFISECNQFINDINHEVGLLTKYIKEIYAQRFPELESIILSPLTYTLTVKRLGNDIDITKKNLSDILPNNSIMSINMMSSTTSGKPLKKDNLEKVLRLCDEAIELSNQKNKILLFIEQRTNIIAPNLTALLGSSVAAKLIVAAGGILELSKIPACNVFVLGAQRVNTEGFSTAGKLHRGYLAELEEVKKTPEEYQTQILRKYANKSVLAARVDALRRVTNTKDQLILSKTESPKVLEAVTQEVNNVIDSEEGKKLKEFIGKKMDRIKEPKAPALKKPLPRPDDKPRRKRGGKRSRGIKQRLERTQMRNLKNTMQFGVAESEYRDTGHGLGMLDKGVVKHVVKKQQINTKKNKQIALQSQAEQQKSGLYSTVSLTQQEGMKLYNPEMFENKLNKAQERYFNPTSGFTTVQKKKAEGMDLLNLSNK